MRHACVKATILTIYNNMFVLENTCNRSTLKEKLKNGRFVMHRVTKIVNINVIKIRRCVEFLKCQCSTSWLKQAKLCFLSLVCSNKQILLCNHEPRIWPNVQSKAVSLLWRPFFSQPCNISIAVMFQVT